MTPQDGDISAPQEEIVAPVTEDAIDYSSPNDIDYELTDEQEQAFVDQILNDGDYKAPVAEVVEPVVDTPEPVVTPPVVDTPVDPVAPVVDAPVETAAPQSDDLWIEVEQVTVDDLGDEVTQTVKLTYDPTDPSSFIPDDFTAKSTKQLAEIMEAKAEMAKLYADRETTYTNAQNEKALASQEQARLDAWDVEIQDLVDAGVIPKQEAGEDAYEKKTDAVFEFMTAENTKRLNEGRPMITAFGTAYTMYENNEAVKAAREAEQQEIVDTKQKGGMVGGGSASSGGAPQTKAYISGSANNIWSVPIE